MIGAQNIGAQETALFTTAAFASCGAAAWGGVPYAALAAEMTPAAQTQAAACCPGAASVLVAAFPYFAGAGTVGNLSCYARGEDYHRVLLRRLGAVCAALALAYPAHRFVPGADNSPLPERRAAQLAGVGMLGANGLVIVPPYGSYVFLGTILTDAPFAFAPAAPAHCAHCGRCTAACPTGALGQGDNCDPARCLSALTQQKGALSAAEEALLARHPLLWGCDSCQKICPHNAGARQTALPEFLENQITTLTAADLAGLSNRTFRLKYGDRAFAWRGVAVLRRNLALHAHAQT